MTEIRTETVPLVDGSALRLTVAEPVSAIRGGIVVLHEARVAARVSRAIVDMGAEVEQDVSGDDEIAVAP